jgi:hypothetical protein
LAKSDEWIRKRVEPVFHIVAIGFPFTTGIAVIAMEMMNPIQMLPGYCWIQPAPSACAYFPEEVPCERGANYMTLNRISNTGLAFLGFVTVAVNMGAIWWTVRTQERNMRKRFPNARSDPNALSRESGTNALLYCGAFFITYLAPAIAVLIYEVGDLKIETSENRDYYFWGWIWTKLFLPLQGFFNAMIYFRQKWKKVQNDKELPSFYIKCRVMLNPHARGLLISGRHPRTADIDQTLSSEVPPAETTPPPTEC